jgi:membrane protein DedA with SNARE-associated domain
MNLSLAVTAFEWLQEAVGGQAWAYPALVAAVALDSVLPIAPGETMVITAGVLAADGELSLPLVVLAALAGSLIGDNISYGLGASLGRRAERRFFSSARARQQVEWARGQLHQRGTVIILAGRFIPGGRTATTFSAGTLEVPWPRFFAIDALAATLWATYVALLGYFGGSAFKNDLWKPILAAGIVAILVASVAELIRRARLV